MIIKIRKITLISTSLIIMASTSLVTSCHQTSSPLELAHQFNEALTKNVLMTNHETLVKNTPYNNAPGWPINKLFININRNNPLEFFNDKTTPNVKNINFNVWGNYYAPKNQDPKNYMGNITKSYINNYCWLVSKDWNFPYFDHLHRKVIIDVIGDFDNQVKSPTGVAINFTMNINYYSFYEIPQKTNNIVIKKLDSSKIDTHLTLIDKNNKITNKSALIQHWSEQWKNLKV